MTKEKKKKVVVPIKIRQKLAAATSMVLVAMIMLVSTTYAWFTLSTAPEVTGITTSVGANGNLEIALLTTDTYADTAKISSAVGDSSANIAVTEANITWGNLIDLSDESYGLEGLTLLPAEASGSGSLATATLLKTPTYGADGRVASLNADTVSVVKSESGFVYANKQTYGVRAVGKATNVSTAQLVYNSAKSDFNSKASNASKAAAQAVASNTTLFVGIAMASTVEAYTDQQKAALIDIADGLKTSLQNIVAAYSDAAIATAISTSSSGKQDTVAILAQSYIGNTDPTVFTTGTLKEHVGSYSSIFTALATSIENVDNAKATISGSGTTEQITAACNKLIGSSSDWEIKDASGNESNKDSLLNGGGSICLAGEYQTVANFAGCFDITELSNIKVKGGKSTTAAAKTTVSAGLAALTAPAGASTSQISDFYGYVIDFAFRTNAADSYLQLQTDAVNRVYADEKEETLATQGSGSNIEYTFTNGLTSDQAVSQLKALRIVFFNPEDGTIYANAQVGNTFTLSAGKATADIKLVNTTDDADNIVALTQNTIQKVSVLVYLDGNLIDNADVINATTSGDLKLNLQFSSSATLVPMDNTQLKQLTK